MGAETVPVQVQVTCDGPSCTESGTSTDAADPTPAGWLRVWGPPQKLGLFYFHNGTCYDNWWAALPAPEGESSAGEGA